MFYKKIAALVVGGMLCLNFLGFAQVKDVVQQGLLVGDSVPDIPIANVYNLNTFNKNNNESKSSISTGDGKTIQLSDYRGKLLILDFWATWCGACVSMMPRMDSLVNVYSEKLAILSVSHQKKEEVLTFISTQGLKSGFHSRIPVATGDLRLGELFPHIYLPHYVWIDDKGVVLAITGLEEINDTNVKRVLESMGQPRNNLLLTQKKDLERSHDNLKPFLFNGNGGEVENLRAHSLLAGYAEGLPSGTKMRLDEKRRYFGLTCTNNSLMHLYSKAWRTEGYFVNKTIEFDGIDSLAFINRVQDSRLYVDWLKNGGGWCYEMWLPTNVPGYDGYSQKQIYDIMKLDMIRYFPQYSTSIEKRKVKCFVVESVDKKGRVRKPLLQAGKDILRENPNAVYSYTGKERIFDVSASGFDVKGWGLNLLLDRLNRAYFGNTDFPLVDKTGENTKVNMTFSGDTKDINRLKEYFASVGLKITLREEYTDVLVVKQNLDNGKGKGDE